MTKPKFRPAQGRPAIRAVLVIGMALCVLYTGYIAFFFPPLVKYGTAGAVADGRQLCAVVGQRAGDNQQAMNAAPTDPFASTTASPTPERPFSFVNPYDAQLVSSAIKEATASCLSTTSVNTPLLLLRSALLLACAAALGWLGRQRHFW